MENSEVMQNQTSLESIQMESIQPSQPGVVQVTKPSLRRTYIAIVIVILAIIVVVVWPSFQSSLQGTQSIADVEQTGANTEEGGELFDQMAQLRNLVPYQNAYFKIESTNELPAFKVTLVQDYEASKADFIGWLASNGLDKFSLSQFEFVTQ